MTEHTADEIVREKKRNLYRLAIARSDVAAAMAGCRHLIDVRIEAGHPLYWTLHNGIVISYCRPFTRNKPYGPLPAKYSTFDDPELRELHSELLDLRDKCVAHSDYDRRKVFIVPHGAALFDTGRAAKGLGTAVQNWALPLAKWEDVHSLCMELGSSISVDAETELQMLYSGDLYTPEPFELRLD